MDPRIENLKSTTFLGKRLTRRQIADIRETVGRFPKLSRTELGHTLCEHLHWQTPNGSNRLQSAQRLLEELERLGILTLPPKQSPGRGRQRPLELGSGSDPQPAIDEPLAGLTPLQLQPVSGQQAVAAWNEWVQRFRRCRRLRPRLLLLPAAALPRRARPQCHLPPGEERQLPLPRLRPQRPQRGHR